MGISQIELKERLQYDPLTGNFLRRRPSTKGGIGTIAGGVSSSGYHSVWILGKTYQAHRLAFLYVTGNFPAQVVDHIDGNKLNNIWTNLRMCSQVENTYNRKLNKDNTSGTKGVYFNKARQKWVVQVRGQGKSGYLGLYDSLELANLVATEARELYHGAYARHL